MKHTRLISVSSVAAALLTCAAVQAAVISFNGTSIGSVGLGQREPFYNSYYSFIYVDGYNHAPRVDPSAYGGSWPTGLHGAVGVSLSGWSSLDNGTPGRYAFDFEGLSLQSEIMDTAPGAMYGHNERWYVGGTWSLIDLNGGGNTTLAAGAFSGPTYMDVNYAGTAPYGMAGTATLTVNNDGGAFYNELNSKSLLMNFACYDAPGVTIPNGDLANAWATYGNASTTLTADTVPEPATFVLGGLGVLALLAFRNRRRKN